MECGLGFQNFRTGWDPGAESSWLETPRFQFSPSPAGQPLASHPTLGCGPPICEMAFLVFLTRLLEDFNKSTVISLVLNILTSPGLSSVIKLITCDSQIDSIFFFCFFVAYKIMLGLKFDGILNLPDGHESILQTLKLQSRASPVKGQLLNFLSRSEAKSPVMARLSL